MQILKAYWIQVFGAVLGSFFSVSASAQIPFNACKTVAHCVDIVNRHAPDSFDYDVLSRDFLRFGRQGRLAVLNMASTASTDKSNSSDVVALEQARRGLMIMARQSFNWRPEERDRLIALWPGGNPQILGQTLEKLQSATVRNRAVQSLSDPRPDVRAVSRSLIAAAHIAEVDAPLPASLIPALATGLLDMPTPALVDLAATLPAPQSTTMLQPVLKSGEFEATRQAYQRLFDQSPETAFNSLVETLVTLKDTDFQAAMAIADMLRVRQTLRSDGFYLNFAKDIALDPKMSVMGRLAGLDALMRAKSAKGLRPTALKHTPLFFETLKAFTGHFNLQSGSVFPRVYLDRFSNLSRTDTDAVIVERWISVLAPVFALRKRGRADFIARLGDFRTPQALSLSQAAFMEDADFTVKSAAIIALAKQGQQAYRTRMDVLARTHPLSHIRLAATYGLRILSGYEDNQPSLVLFKSIMPQVSAQMTPSHKGQIKNADGVNLDAVNKGALYCETPHLDFREYSRGMPYFDSAIYSSGKSSSRSNLKSAVGTRNGWLAGYVISPPVANKYGGGLFYYDNKSGQGVPLLEHPVQAILAVKQQALGQYPNAYWAVSYAPPSSDDPAAIESYAPARLYRIKMGGPLPQVALALSLPHIPTRLGHTTDGRVVMAFARSAKDKLRVNPPLIIDQDAKWMRACELSSQGLIQDGVP